MKSPYICNLSRVLTSADTLAIRRLKSIKGAATMTTMTTMVTTMKDYIKDKEHQHKDDMTTCIPLRDLCSYLSRLLFSQFSCTPSERGKALGLRRPPAYPPDVRGISRPKTFSLGCFSIFEWRILGPLLTPKSLLKS